MLLDGGHLGADVAGDHGLALADVDCFEELVGVGRGEQAGGGTQEGSLFEARGAVHYRNFDYFKFGLYFLI